MVRRFRSDGHVDLALPGIFEVIGQASVPPLISFMKHIYLDYNATSPLKPAIYEGMLPYLKEHFGNPSSIHWAGRQARKAMMEARERIARFLRVDAEEIVFTSSGTEANNLALKGTFEAFKHSGKHIITSQ